MGKLREKWHPKLREKILEKKLTLIDIATTVHCCEACVALWVKVPERIPVEDAIKLCELLDIPLAEIEDYFTWEGVKKNG